MAIVRSYYLLQYFMERRGGNFCDNIKNPEVGFSKLILSQDVILTCHT